MIYLLDTNILLRLVKRDQPAHPVVQAAIRMLWSEGHQFVTTPQNCSELWNAATRPMNKNGFGLSISEANRSLRLVERLFPLLPDTPAIYPEWRRLVVQTGVSGVQVHDARLVAAMLVHGVTHILTFNVADFNRYAGEGVVVVDPTTV